MAKLIMKYLIILLLLISFPAFSCSFSQREERKRKAAEEVKKLKKNYQLLSNNLTDGTLKRGSSREDVRLLYGEPTDILKSGSNVSDFEIWTYEKITDNTKDQGWDSIRLYFDNDKLISWKY